MIDWDYEVYCPNCGTEYTLEYNPDGGNKVKMRCDECGQPWTIKASAEVNIEVEVVDD